MHRFRFVTLAGPSLAAGLMLAGAAQSAAPISLTPIAATSPASLDPALQRNLLALRYAPGEPTPQAGVARTAIDRSLGKGGVTASAGFLCGRGAGPDNNGAATERGYDPEGRFVGAKLSISFK